MYSSEFKAKALETLERCGDGLGMLNNQRRPDAWRRAASEHDREEEFPGRAAVPQAPVPVGRRRLRRDAAWSRSRVWRTRAPDHARFLRGLPAVEEALDGHDLKPDEQHRDDAQDDVDGGLPDRRGRVS